MWKECENNVSTMFIYIVNVKKKFGGSHHFIFVADEKYRHIFGQTFKLIWMN